jgi:small nuclear ribonucleoprotein (snRNP)-like protein
MRSLPVTGVLKGFDQLMNLVLDDVKEITSGKHLIPLRRSTADVRQTRTETWHRVHLD